LRNKQEERMEDDAEIQQAIAESLGLQAPKKPLASSRTNLVNDQDYEYNEALRFVLK
jgi:hypothetical protein